MKNSINYKLKNLNKERIVNELSKKVKISSIKTDEENLYISINKNYKKIAENYFNFRNIEIKEAKEEGILKALKNFFCRIGVIISVVIFIAFFVISNLFVFKTKILGLQNVEIQEINKVLTDSKLNGCILKSKINLTKLQNDLQKIDNVSLVSAVIKGNTLIINIKEKVFNEEYSNKDNFEPLVAKFDAKITEISLLQGTSAVKEGQFVKKGDVLVYPYTINSNGEKLGILAMADIKGEVYYTKTNTYYDEKYEMIDTGNVVVVKELTCFNVPIYKSSMQKQFNEYRVETKEQYLSNNNCLPIKQIITTYYEQKKELIKCDFDSNEQSYKQQLSSEIYSMLDECDNVMNEYSHIEYNLGIHSLTYTVVVNKSIC